MERYDDDDGVHQYYAPDFGLIGFMDEANLDHLINLVRGENNVVDQPIFDDAVVTNGSCHFLPPPPPPYVEVFDSFDDVVTTGVLVGDGDGDELGLLMNACQAEEEELLLMDQVDDSSGSGTKTGGGKGDRSRTLVSERRRRGRMKEKLYALRSLVPNITKMDKASIVGDAVLYVQDLQMQAKKLKAEIADLESGEDKQNLHKTSSNLFPITNKIFKMEVTEVEEKGYYVRIVSNRGKGVAMLLYRALESLTTFTVHTSNLSASALHNYVFTFTLHTMDGGMDVNLQSVKVWIASVFLHHGFEFQT